MPLSLLCAFIFFITWQVNKEDSPFKIGKDKFPVIKLDLSRLSATGNGDANTVVADAVASMAEYIAAAAQNQHGIDVSDAGTDISLAFTL